MRGKKKKTKTKKKRKGKWHVKRTDGHTLKEAGSNPADTLVIFHQKKHKNSRPFFFFSYPYHLATLYVITLAVIWRLCSLLLHTINQPVQWMMNYLNIHLLPRTRHSFFSSSSFKREIDTNKVRLKKKRFEGWDYSRRWVEEMLVVVCKKKTS